MITFNDMHDVLTDEEWEALNLIASTKPALKREESNSYAEWLFENFTWSRAPQGIEFWRAIHGRLEVLDDGPNNAAF
jgi:hypothetical protein